jgi:4-diphosphocytidyl-2-C-methyl-D-erythritol kinase
VTVDFADVLTFEDGDGLDVVGLGIPDGENLVAKALRAVDRAAYVTLEKHIPAGAGLGGGSADAAAVLRWASVFDPAVAIALGGDVPFCVLGGRARVRGIGEVVESLPYVAETFTLSIPPLHVSTPAVYRAWDELDGPTADGPNDLEPAALRVAPELARYRDELGDATGQTPILAGSGATWFVRGEFRDAGRVVTTLPTSPPGGVSVQEVESLGDDAGHNGT